ncbi:MAG: hypothetical protein PHP45_00975 [Elusimicrobiales bacterium]|nr:hypothetical protein [Elusimicrobiales bacterium]
MNNLTKLLFAVIFTLAFLALRGGDISAQEQSTSTVSVSTNTAEAEEALQEEQQAKERKVLEQIHAVRKEILDMKVKHQKELDELTEKQRARRAARCAAEGKNTEECAQVKQVKTDWRKLSPLERSKRLASLKSSRKIEIKPQKQSDGIKTGLVVAYGHLIPPPYNVDYIDHRLFINGVQVQPSLIEQRNSREHPFRLSPEKRAIQDKAGEFINAAVKVYRGEKTEDMAAVKKQILDMFAKHPDMILNPEWRGETLCYATPVFRGTSCIYLGPPRNSLIKVREQGTEEKKKIEEFFRKEQVSSVETILRAGKMIYIPAVDSGVLAKDVCLMISKIMQNSNLDNAKKAEALFNIVRSYSFALDLIENYTPAEWSMCK